MPVKSLNLHNNQTNAEKITAANISLEFLKKEVRKLTEEQKTIREMLLEIMEQTRPFEMVKNEDEDESGKSWFWGS